jgi:Chaperone for flagella basal body P-ring formation
MTKSNKFRMPAVITLLAWLFVSGSAAQGASVQNPFSQARVADALTQSGLRTSADQIQFLFAAGSAHRNARLHVVSTTKWIDGMRKAHLRCENTSECLPFYVIVRNKTGHSNDASQAPEPAEIVTAAVLHGGQPTTLFLQSQTMQITLPVVCLQNGRPGDHIRVASLDRKRTYNAEVLESGVVKGVL